MQQVRLFQNSHKTFAVQIKNIAFELLKVIIQKIKHGGVWNVALQTLQFPLQNTTNMLKQLKMIDQNVMYYDVPSSSIKSLLCPQSNIDSKMGVLMHKSKWTRIWLLDPLLVKRYQYVADFVLGKRTKNIQRESYRKILLFCYQAMQRSWIENVFKKHQMPYKAVDYQSLESDQRYRIKNPVLKQTQIQILTYQRLHDIGDLLRKNVLDKYTTLICDDSQVWFNASNTLYHSHSIGLQMKKVILEKFRIDRELILITGSVPGKEVNRILSLASLIKPKQFGLDLLYSHIGQTNDATWMRRRYAKQGTLNRQFLYLLQSSILINLMAEQKKPEEKGQIKKSDILYDHIVPALFSSSSTDRLRQLDKKYRNINRKQVISSFQDQRKIGNYLNSSRMQQANYLKDLRQIMTEQKMMNITQFINHLARQLQQRTVVVVENQWLCQKIENYLRQQQIRYWIYEIDAEEVIRKNKSYSKFNRQKDVKVCIIVREKLLKQYKKAQNEVNNYIEQCINRQYQQDLRIQRGGIFQLTKRALNDPIKSLLQQENQICLPKITTARHVIYVDIFWHQFSSQKQKIVQNILNHHSQMLNQVQADEKGRNQQGLVTSWKQFYTHQQSEKVRHFIICKESNQKNFLLKYLNNLSNFVQDRKKQQKNVVISVKTFKENLIDLHRQTHRKRKTIQMFDVDLQFDKVQFQARKQAQNDVTDDLPKWNTHIEGLVIQTPYIEEPILKKKVKTQLQQILQENIKDSPSQEKSLNSDGRIKIIAQRKDVNIQEIQWLRKQESKNDDSFSDVSSIDLAQYLIQQKQQKQLQKMNFLSNRLENRPCEKNVRQQEKNQSDSSVGSLHLSMDEIMLSRNKIKNRIESSEQQQSLDVFPKTKQNIYSQQKPLKNVILPQSMPLKPEPVVIDIDDLPQIKPAFRMIRPPLVTRTSKVGSCALWGRQQKTIARKYKTLKIKLIPNKSSLNCYNQTINQ